MCGCARGCRLILAQKCLWIESPSTGMNDTFDSYRSLCGLCSLCRGSKLVTERPTCEVYKHILCEWVCCCHLGYVVCCVCVCVCMLFDPGTGDLTCFPQQIVTGICDALKLCCHYLFFVYFVYLSFASWADSGVCSHHLPLACWPRLNLHVGGLCWLGIRLFVLSLLLVVVPTTTPFHCEGHLPNTNTNVVSIS